MDNVGFSRCYIWPVSYWYTYEHSKTEPGQTVHEYRSFESSQQMGPIWNNQQAV